MSDLVVIPKELPPDCLFEMVGQFLALGQAYMLDIGMLTSTKFSVIYAGFQ